MKDIRWDTSVLVASDDDFEKGFENLEIMKKKLVSFEGRLANKEDFKQFLKTNEEFEKEFVRLSLFVSLEKSTDIENAKILAKRQKLAFFGEQLSKDMAFVSIEQKAFSGAYIKELLKDAELAPYHRSIEKIEQAKKHILKKNEEILLSGAAYVDQYESIYRALITNEIKFEEVILASGKKFLVSESNYGKVRLFENEQDRKNCTLALLKGYARHNLSIATNYLASVKSDDFFATSRNYESAFARALEDEEVSKKVYENLIAGVHHNLDTFYDYTKSRKKRNNGKLAITDMGISMFKLPKIKYDFDKSFEIVKRAVLPLGEDYLKGLDLMVENKRIDAFPRKGKRSGAYETTDQMGHIFVMLNHVDEFSSMETMAHELGHAMHSFYSENTQPYPLRGYEIFVAEVASTVNELLLLEHMAKTAKKETERLAYVEKMIQMAQQTIFRQTMFAEFEEWVHENIHKGVPITYLDLNKKYLQLVELYFGKSVKIFPEFQYEWSRIPHFYSSFYVYKYATGMLSAMLIVKKIKENPNFVLEYKQKFLSAGCSKDPVSILKDIGVDLERPETIDEAFELFGNWVKEFKRG